MLQHAYARTYASRRPARPHTTAISLVAAIHVVLIFGLIHGLNQDGERAQPRGPITTSVDIKEPDDGTLPPPPPPTPLDLP